MTRPPEPARRLRALPPTIWALGFGSLLMDMSSELVHALLPVYLVTVLGASMLTIGLIEGLAEATAAVTKVVSGAASDRLRRRKPIVVLGYALSALSKPLFPLATSVAWVFGARFADRVGKGIRGAPRDALIVESVAPAARGAAFGLRQALDSAGAFLGPLLAVACLFAFAGDLRAALWVAVVPALLAVLVLVVAVRESSPAGVERPARPAWRDTRLLPPRFWLVVALGAVFTLARFSEAFLVLRARDVGLALTWVPTIMIVMNVVYAAGAYPAGALSDRIAARTLLVAGLAVLVAADLTLALASSPAQALAGAALWGLHMALTQGLLSKLVADAAPAGLRGTAFGVFHLVSGGALLAASVVAGALWSRFGPAATFAAGAVFATLAAAGLLAVRPRAGASL